MNINNSLNIFGISIVGNKISSNENSLQNSQQNNHNVANLDKLLKSYKDYYDELTKAIPILEGSIQDKILKGEMSQEEIWAIDDFKEKNKASMHWLDEDLQREYISIYHTSMDIEEFKQRWLELQSKHDSRLSEIAEQSQRDIEKEMQMLQTKETKNPRTPIQSESQNKETYKDDNAKNELLKKLLENKFGKSEELELLFGIKFSDDKTGEFSKILSKNTPKSVDIKA
ncbi:hypothetical protein HEE88_000093 [Campylobacter upsaliensis]|uniref:Uncharacterized protein n=1 Tax=Campylobacter upsaliensis TaxID=28080 RepID=A0A5L4UXF8_CAMUP|nr:hypothetical protein [Campylobacter upsaliensis]EAI4457216.1 hypothetical protein [Campylobacter upsaliensis]EAI6142979.1 hypothetical protein [Campylobacter upsaliensis]EAJ2438764.1 hypothetical protein [Campylobacter upsaliensis]EAJ3971699.1 hypothetical protein [Campylobacter upsaliensis]EAJ7104815.1 hypothetical protein [Campylobacter upsaliensis]